MIGAAVAEKSGLDPAELFRIAAQISTPLGLAGVIAVIFLLIALSKAPANSAQRSALKYAFILALAAIGLAALGLWIKTRPTPISYTGNVFRAGTKNPVSGAKVSLAAISNVPAQETDSAGLFDFDIPPDAGGKSTVLTVSHTGFVDWTGRRRIQEPLPAEIVPLEPVDTPAPPPTPTPTAVPPAPPPPGGGTHVSGALLHGVAAVPVMINHEHTAAVLAAEAHVLQPSPAPGPGAATHIEARATAAVVLPSPETGWVYYGTRSSSGWSERLFKVVSKPDGAAEPQAGDAIEALGNVSVRSGPIEFSLFKGWQNQRLDGILHAGDRVRVQEVKRIANDRVWLRFVLKG